MPQIFILLKKKNHTQGKLFYYLRSLQENPETTGKTKTRTGEEILVSDNTAITRSKHSLMSSQIKLTLKVYLPLSLLTKYIMSSFQRKELQSMLKGKIYRLKKQTKHQNQIQIWQRFWKDQTGDF